MKVRILDPGFLNLTGVFGRFNFTDGVSDEISQADAEYLGCIVRVEVVGGDDEGKNPSVTQQMVDRRDMELKEVMTTNPVAEAEARKAAEKALKDKQLKESVKASIAANEEARQAKAAAEVVDPATLDYTYTKEDLGALVKKGGIAELRAFTESYGIKGTSVNKIITGMLELKEVYAKPAAAEVPEGAPAVPVAEEGEENDVVETTPVQE